MDPDKPLALLYLICNTLATSYAYTCSIDVSIRDAAGGHERILTFVDCNSVFEMCCEDGCCARFNHAHIWMFAAALSFIIFICIFGCWLFCCKEKFRRTRTLERPPQIDEHVDSPLTLVIPETRNDIRRVNNQNVTSIPVTPPPTYEEATAMR